MGNKSTEYSLQELKNLSADVSVSPPIPREGMLGKDNTGTWRDVSIDTDGKLNVNAEVTIPPVTIDTTGLATDSNQTSGAQKTQIVDAGGEAVTVTGGKLDVNASVDTTGLATSAKQDAQTALLTTIDADTSTLAGAVSGTEMQVDVVGPLPAGTNNIGKFVITDGSNDVQVMPANGEMGLVVVTPSHISTDNSTSTPLSGGGVFTGTWEEATNHGVISVIVKASHASATDGFSIQYSSDGTNMDASDEYTIPASTGKLFSFQCPARYFRIVYTNGATLQTYFRMQTILKPTYVKPSSHRIADSLTLDDDAELTKAVIAGETTAGGGSFVNVKVNPSGSLTTAGQINDGTDTLLITAAGEANVFPTARPGVDMGDVTINNSTGAAAVNIQDGGNTITVDGTVAVTQSGTWDEVGINDSGNSITVDQATGSNLHTVVDSGTITTVSTVTSVTAIANALPAGNNNIGDVDIASMPAITGSVTADTELPAAAALADTTANPTVPGVGSYLMGYNGTTWDRLHAEYSTAENLATQTGLYTIPQNRVWDGSNWDRMPGNSTDGTLVNLGSNNDVTVTGSVTSTESTPTSFGSNQKVVTTAGTQVQLQTNSCLGVTVKALSTNTGLIYVGASAVDSSTGFVLSASESVSLAVDNTNRIWIDSSVNGEGVSFAYVS